MYTRLSLTFLALKTISCEALPDLLNRAASVSSWPWALRRAQQLDSDTNTGINFNPNGSAFLWLPSDEYSGSTFFE